MERYDKDRLHDSRSSMLESQLLAFPKYQRVSSIEEKSELLLTFRCDY